MENLPLSEFLMEQLAETDTYRVSNSLLSCKLLGNELYLAREGHCILLDVHDLCPWQQEEIAIASR